MKDFKRKIITRLALNARAFNLKHRKLARTVTILVLGIIAIICLTVYGIECLLRGLKSFVQMIVEMDLRQRIAFAMGVILFVSSGSALFYANNVYNKGEKIYEQVSEVYVTEAPELMLADENSESDGIIEKTVEDESTEDIAPESDNTEEVSSEDENALEENYEEALIPRKEWDTLDVDLGTMESEYPETVGWLYFEDGSISYPIMQSDDNEKYLSTGYTGDELRTGAIFLDYRSDKNFTDSNSIIYGHNMKDGSMFGSLKRYKNESGFYADHQFFQIITPEKKYRYQVFAYMDVPGDYIVYDLTGEDSKDFIKDLEMVRRKSYIGSDIEVDESQKIVTLSTCTYKDTLRFIVLGVLVDEN